MAKQYRHLTEKDRIFLRVMLERRYPKNKIAEILGVHRSTIYRELKRNCFKHWRFDFNIYWSDTAHQNYLDRRKRTRKIDKNKNLKNYVHSKLKSGWSPWQIEGRLKLENMGQCIISHETIYRAKLKQKYISRLIEEINNRPLKCLDYKTPQEVFQQSISN
jgi:IS30 family transposase